jgi:hypothetical protein
MLEHRTDPLLPRRAFLLRLAKSAGAGLVLVAICLGIGMLGYHGFEKLSWVDSFANASMILSGMGPMANLQTSGGKIFAGCYALFSGLAFITIIGLVLTPVVHRFLHKFHIDSTAKKSASRDSHK